MTDAKKTSRGHVLMGLILGLVLAAVAALAAFFLMSKPTNMKQQAEEAPIQSEINPNKTLQNKVPYTPFNKFKANDAQVEDSENSEDITEKPKKTGNLNSGKKENTTQEEAIEQVIREGVKDPIAKPKKIERELVEETDNFGETKLIQKIKETNKRIVAEEDPVDPIGALAREANAEKIDKEQVKEIKKIKTNDATYYVQVGAFKSSEQADHQKAVLTMQGLNAKISEVELEGNTMHRVRLGPFYSKEETDRAQKRLQAEGVSYKVIKVND